MTSRRSAFRLNLGRPGILHFHGHQATCVVIDISAMGARVRVMPPTLIPDRLVLETKVADRTVEMSARLIRSEESFEIAMLFDNPEYRYLHKLLHEEQRQIIASGIRATVDRRSAPRDGGAEDAFDADRVAPDPDSAEPAGPGLDSEAAAGSDQL